MPLDFWNTKVYNKVSVRQIIYICGEGVWLWKNAEKANGWNWNQRLS